MFANLGRTLLQKGDTTRAIEAVNRGIQIVPVNKIPHDFFTIGFAEILYRAGKTEDAGNIIDEIIRYSKQYLDYAITVSPEKRFGLEYPIGINMQALLDIYHMSVDIKLDSLTEKVEPDINFYYGLLYSSK